MANYNKIGCVRSFCDFSCFSIPHIRYFTRQLTLTSLNPHKVSNHIGSLTFCPRGRSASSLPFCYFPDKANQVAVRCPLGVASAQAPVFIPPADTGLHPSHRLTRTYLDLPVRITPDLLQTISAWLGMAVEHAQSSGVGVRCHPFMMGSGYVKSEETCIQSLLGLRRSQEQFP